ncbi:deoxyribodipyrimidine photo-lyase [Marinospirillum celere]|uniref:Cryptochrome DASH n=1 Tax=Marinospirillum celere TaxID=1122252 RepID=A0A1I1DXQ2_9GAMM|nr:DASH family cryptochrome [Marinospirillum celere]SFB79604.1 deoxyribodipyrimidine photo-lyase [Marinospirillum celere]
MAKTGLYLFTQDLRLSDNPLLLRAAQENDYLLLVYAVDPNHFKPKAFSLKRLGQHRWRFLLDALDELNHRLRGLNQHLQLLFDQPLRGLSQLIDQHQVGSFYISEQVGYYENQLIKHLQARFTDLSIQQLNTQRIWDLDEIPFSLSQLPGTFTQFRKQVEQLKIESAFEPITELPPSPKQGSLGLQELPNSSQATQPLTTGGEVSAQAHLAEYFSTDQPSTYKQTRNALQGRFQSTGFSPWLAQGCLSPRQILQELANYEASKKANESTYWIFFELMWREYFQLYALTYGARLFHFQGIQGRKPLTSFYPQRFKAWCEGETQWPLINACMKQLKATGWMSNRGRQLVASCLVNELQLDWRYGAAWFEQELIDYDVGSNWGNWQYLAGVGADPRGSRHFNLEKQAALYDPDGDFTRLWQGDATSGVPLYSVDAADWPFLSSGSE